MTRTQAILVGCGVATLVVAVGAVAGVAGLYYLGQDPPDVVISVEGPTTVPMGEEFTVTIVVANDRQDRPFRLSDIDIADAYLNNFIVLGTDPRASASHHIPIDDTRSFSFNRTVPPGTAMRFEFRLRPTAPGIARGDVDVCEGVRFLSTFLQTEITGED